MPARDPAATPHVLSSTPSAPPSMRGRSGSASASSAFTFTHMPQSQSQSQSQSQAAAPGTYGATHDAAGSGPAATPAGPSGRPAALPRSRSSSAQGSGSGRDNRSPHRSPTAPATATMGPRRVSEGIVGRFFRRLSTVSNDAPGMHEYDHPPSDDALSETGEHEEDWAMDDSHSSAAIRESTNRLASMSFTGRSYLGPGASGITLDHRPLHPSPLTETGTGTVELGSPPASGAGTSPEVSAVSPHSGPSGLSVLMERGRKAAEPGATAAAPSDEGSGDTTPNASAVVVAADPASPLVSRITLESHQPHALEQVPEAEDEDMGGSSELRQYLERAVEPADGRAANERTPLLDKKRSWRTRTAIDFAAARNNLAKVTPHDVFRACVVEPLECLPAVVLGLLLNVLDGVSYGMILFPVSPYFPDFGSLGVSMFFVSCIVGQLTYSLGGSIFKGGNGSMMIESVPFFHVIAATIISEIGDDRQAIVATFMVSLAFSSILTGLVFFALGAFRLGALIGYFPRHILVGCIGGVGVFLFITGFEVSLDLGEDGFKFNKKTLELFISSPHMIALWTIPLALAVLLRVITHFFHHQLIFPAYFLTIPAIFYVVVFAGGWSFDTLRENGWVFDVGKNVQPWWKFYTEFNFRAVNWGVFWLCMPTQLATVFFGILHVPLNIPALGVSLSEDNVKLDRELVAHGVSNMASGFVGSVPNYLCYVNTVLFYRVGGGSTLSGIMLAAATAGIMFVGPTVIGYLPIMVVAALIFVLGIDLMIEAVWDTRHRVNRMEYITIWVIMIGMTVFDFVIGLLIGIILACVFFVVQSSRRRPIRTVFNGATAKSTVRRPRAQRAFIESVGSQTYVMKLHGFLFFGTIGVVEDEIRKLLDVAKWENSPIRFLIIDFALVAGLDFSSAEAFVRIQRLLAAKDVLLILCGAAPHGLVGTALRNVDLWADQEGSRVEVFASLNDALEWTENAYLTAFYENQRRVAVDQPPRTIDLPKIARMPFSLAESFQNSPRRSHLAKAGDDTLPHNYGSPAQPPAKLDDEHEAEKERKQPLPILLQTIGSYTDEPESFFAAIAPYFKQVVVHAGDVLWRQGDAADGLYIIEAGSLRATYAYDHHAEDVQQTMVAGTVAGDLSTLSDTLRNATVIAERDAVLWKLEPEKLAQMERDKPEITGKFIKIVLKAAVEEVDVLASHLIAVLS